MDPTKLLDRHVLTGGQSTAEIIHKTIVLLDDDIYWCQGALALDAHGRRVKPNDPNAARVCIAGAVARSSNDLGVVPPHILEFLDQLVLEFAPARRIVDNSQDAGDLTRPGIYNKYDLSWFNDQFDHETVMNFLHEAYRRCS